jgi:hypothetical protein
MSKNILLSMCDVRVFLTFTFTNKTDRNDITEILLKVALNTITLNPDYTLY